MAKRIFPWMVLLTVLVPLLFASSAAPGATPKTRTHTPPKYCNPCLFYGGDFDTSNPAANALINDSNSSLDGEVYVPFTVPKQQKWDVTVSS